MTEAEDTDDQGARLAMQRNMRFVSDSLHFTGIDLGDRMGGTRRHRRRGGFEGEDGDSTSSESDGEEDEDDDEDSGDGDSDYMMTSHLSPEEREEMLVQSALQRISRAQAREEANVRLNKQELAAFARHQKRVEAEERARRRANRRSQSRGDGKRRAKEQRVAVPLTQLAPTSRKKRSPLASSADFPPRQDSLHIQESVDSEHSGGQTYPPMGYFPPPSAARSRPRAGTATLQRPSSHMRDDYEYHDAWVPPVNPPGSSRGSPRHDAPASVSQTHLDPFQYQTAGPRAPHAAGAAAASRRYVSSPPGVMYEERRGTASPAAAGGRQGSRQQQQQSPRQASYDEDTSEASSPTSEESTSDDRGRGAQIRPGTSVAPSTGRVRAEAIVVEESPDRGARSKKKPSSLPIKRKPVEVKKKKK